MSSYNKVILMGNLTRDPDLRVTSSGMSICKFSIAVSRKFKDKEGVLKDDTAFVDIDSFGNMAENVSKYFTKGKPIFLEGRLKFDQWEDKSSGQKRSKLGVVLERFEFVGSKGGGQSSGGGYDDVSPPARDATPANENPSVREDAPADNVDEDVPF